MQIFKCSICGKTSNYKKNIKFDDRDFKLKIKNFKGNTYNLYLNISAIEENDEKIIEELEQIASKTYSKSDVEQIKEDIDDLQNNLKDNHAILCSFCKKELIKLTHSYGRQDRFEKF